MAMSVRALSGMLRPCRCATPNSVTTVWTCARAVTTPAPGASSATMRERRPRSAVAGSAMMVAQRPRHRPVELGDHGVRGADGRERHVVRSAQRAVAVRVGPAPELHRAHSACSQLALEQPRDVLEQAAH
jgi:hypothetical protein